MHRLLFGGFHGGSWLCCGSRAGVGLEWAGKVPSEVLWFLGAVSDLCISSGHGIQAVGSFVWGLSCFSELHTGVCTCTKCLCVPITLCQHQPSWQDGQQWGKRSFCFSDQHNSISSEGINVIQPIQSSMPVFSHHMLSPRVLWNLFSALQEGRVLQKKKKGKTHNQNSQCYSMEFIPQDRNSHTGQGKKNTTSFSEYHFSYGKSLRVFIVEWIID